jgi:DNA repair photolyase
MAKISGTKEWSVASCNVQNGCEHNCRYCYARAQAMRYKRLDDPAAWSKAPFLRIRHKDLVRKWKKRGGTVMFPTTHDVTPDNLPACEAKLLDILRAGDSVLIVSKPHLRCVKVLCDSLWEFKRRVMFRFSIGSWRGSVLDYWEPDAPGFVERMDALEWAYSRGFDTSVSCEPLLSPELKDVSCLRDLLNPYVSHSIWIGKMNRIKQRVVAGTDSEEIARIERGQTDEHVRAVYELLKNEPKVRWKESYKKVLGLPLAGEPGLDV